MVLSKNTRMLQILNSILRIHLKDGRVLVGKMIAFDRHMNLVLADCEEFRKAKKAKQQKTDASSSSSSTTAAVQPSEQKRTLGLVILRGATVVSMSIEAPPPVGDAKSRKAASAFGGVAVPGIPTGPGVVRPAGRGLPVAPIGMAPMGLAGPVRGVGGPMPPPGFMPPPGMPPFGARPGMPPGMPPGMMPPPGAFPPPGMPMPPGMRPGMPPPPGAFPPGMMMPPPGMRPPPPPGAPGYPRPPGQ